MSPSGATDCIGTFVREANEKDDWAMVSAVGGIVNVNTIYCWAMLQRVSRERRGPMSARRFCGYIMAPSLAGSLARVQGAGVHIDTELLLPPAITITIKPHPMAEMGLGQQHLDHLSPFAGANCYHDCDQRHCRAERNASCYISPRRPWLSGGWAESLMHNP